MNQQKNPQVDKKKGHQICPNCSKETFLILHYGLAEYWCRRCRRYFKIKIEKAE